MDGWGKMKYLLNYDELRKYLDQKEPFIFIDRILEIESGKRLVAIKNISGNDPWFSGHFPGKAIMPGALLLEGIAQASLILARFSESKYQKKTGLFSSVKTKFLSTIIPGDQVKIEVSVVKLTSMGGVFEAEAFVENKKCATAELVCGFVDNKESDTMPVGICL